MASRTSRTRRGALSAAIVTAVVLGAILIEQVLVGTLSLVQGTSFGVPASQMLETSAIGTLAAAGLTTLPLAIGVFVSLWQVAPIGPELRVGHVLSRSTLAVGIGAVLALIVSSIGGMTVDFLRYQSSIFSGGAATFAAQVPFTLGYSLVAAVSAFLTALPLVALAAILLWIRLREKDRGYAVEGMLDL